jgi:hypothetical protein
MASTNFNQRVLVLIRDKGPIEKRMLAQELDSKEAYIAHAINDLRDAGEPLICIHPKTPTATYKIAETESEKSEYVKSRLSELRSSVSRLQVAILANMDESRDREYLERDLGRVIEDIGSALRDSEVVH